MPSERVTGTRADPAWCGCRFAFVSYAPRTARGALLLLSQAGAVT